MMVKLAIEVPYDKFIALIAVGFVFQMIVMQVQIHRLLQTNIMCNLKSTIKRN